MIDPKEKTQATKFIETARQLGCDKSEKRFNAALRTIAKQKPRHNEPKKPKRKKSK